jgi:hypothetical protein
MAALVPERDGQIVLDHERAGWSRDGTAQGPGAEGAERVVNQQEMGFQAGTVTKAFLMELEKVPLQVLDDLGTAQKPEQF